MSKRALRHGELHTRAWNPSIRTDAYAFIEVDGEPIEVRSMRIDKVLADTMQAHEPGVVRFRVYAAGDARIIASIDNTKHGRLLHVSVSRLDRLPSWWEMIAIKRHFYPPDVAAVMVAPEEEVYVNVHEHTLHWWQLPEKWGLR